MMPDIWSKRNTSKLSYYKTMSIIYLDKYRWLKFGIVGSSGIIVNLALLWMLTETFGISYILSASLAFIVSVSNNYYWNYKWTFYDKEIGIFTGWLKYASMAITTWLMYIVIVIILTEYLDIWYLLSASIAIFLTFIVRYIIANNIIWKN